MGNDKYPTAEITLDEQFHKYLTPDAANKLTPGEVRERDFPIDFFLAKADAAILDMWKQRREKDELLIAVSPANKEKIPLAVSHQLADMDADEKSFLDAARSAIISAVLFKFLITKPAHLCHDDLSHIADSINQIEVALQKTIPLKDVWLYAIERLKSDPIRLSYNGGIRISNDVSDAVQKVLVEKRISY